MKKLMLTAALALTCGMTAAQTNNGASCSKKSPAHSVALLELYTSEGCSSCPPADKFVSGLRASGITQEQAVLLSMHVDYWDYIGWKDPYAKREMTERQRWLANLAGSNTVYTPEIFMSGKELRNWRSNVAGAVKQINSKPAQADIGLSLGKAQGGNLPVEVNVKTAHGVKLYLALIENGIKTDVKAGENSGVQLRHDFVVREWSGPIKLADAKDKAVNISRNLAVPANAVEKNLSVAAFVQDEKGVVLQALALPLCSI